MGIILKIIQPTDTNTLQQIYELRYHVYKSMYPQYFPDHPKEIREDTDANSYILGAYLNQKLIGTIRYVIYKEHGCNTELVKQYRIMDIKGINVENAAEAGRLCVLNELQNHGVSILIIKESLKIILKLNPKFRFLFFETIDSLIKYYELMYCKQTSLSRFDPTLNKNMYLLYSDIFEFLSHFDSPNIYGRASNE